MKRLIIKQGERVTRHELGEKPLTIGRDPGCDLFFSDQRLSRKHCRVVATPEGVRFEDLGSRNGIFLGEKRVEVVNLAPRREVRVGGLFISYEDDTPAAPAPGAGESATVMLERGALDAPATDEDKTVILGSRAPEPPEPADADKTAILPVATASQKDEPGLAKTRILDTKAVAAELDKKVPGPSDTMILTQDAAPPRPASRSIETPPPPPPPDQDAAPSELGWTASLSWSAKLLVVLTSVAVLVYMILAFPLVRTLGNALREESLRRGRALLQLAAAGNGNAVGEGRIRDASVDNILREERVKEALLLDLEGNVLAPSSRADEVLTSIDGIDAALSEIRTFYLGRRGGDYVMVQPLLHRSRRVGFAIVVYEAATASASWATAVLFLAFLVTALGVVSALVVGKRMTLAPLSNFRDDVEAVIKRDAEYVPRQQGFAELSELARSVNRLIARAFAAAPAGATRSAVAAAPAAPIESTSAPAPAAAPQAAGPAGAADARRTSPKRPVTEAVQARPDPGAAQFWVDANFIVVRADEEAAALVGATAAGMEGKHLIEAVGDQHLLEVILDAVNALEELPAAETSAELPGGRTLHVSASRDQGNTVLGLRQL